SSADSACWLWLRRAVVKSLESTLKHLRHRYDLDRHILERIGGDDLVLGENLVGSALRVVGQRSGLARGEGIAQRGGVASDNGNFETRRGKVAAHGGIHPFNRQPG